MNSNNGTGGYLYNRIRYLRNKKSNSNVEQNSGNNDIMNTSEGNSCSYQMDSLLYLKTTVVSEQNLTEFKEKLKVTLPLRTQMIKDKNVDFLEQFPYLFVRPTLVSMIV